MSDSNSLPNANPTVAVVNDDVIQLNILCGLLRKAGFKSEAYKSAEAALAAMPMGSPPALIITDLYMPGIDGWRFCHLLRSPEYFAFNQIPILVVSATFEGDEISRITTEIGANSFLPMPVDGRQFIERVQSLLKGGKRFEMVNVLIAESDRQLSFSLMKTFQAHGYQVGTAFTYKEAMHLLDISPYHMAVLDYDLPDGMGDELLKTIRQNFSDCICIMMTADPQPEIALSWIKMGASDYVQRPFDPEYVILQCERARRERSLIRSRDLLNQRTRQLWESEEKYRSLVQHTSDAIFSFNMDGTYRFANEALAKVYGIKSEEIIGKTIYDFFPQEEAEKRMALVQQVFKSGEKGTVEGKVVTHNGEERYYLTLADPVKDEHGTVIYANCISKDITERRNFESALYESEQKYRLLYESAGVGIGYYTPQGIIISFNKKASEHMSGKPEDFRGKSIHDIFPRESAEFYFNRIKAAAASEIPQVYIDQVQLPSMMSWFHTTFTRVLDTDGKVIGIQVISTDISEAKHSEQLMLESKAKLDAALSSMTDAVFISDLEGNFIDFNDAFATFHKFKNKEECAKTLVEYPVFLDVYMANGELAPLDQWAVRRALRGETGNNVEYSLRRKDTGESWVGSYSFAPIRDEDGKIVGSVVVGRDITEQKLAEQALRESDQKYRTLFETSMDGILITNPDGDIKNANPAACRMLGMTNEEIKLAGRSAIINLSDPHTLAALEERQRTGFYKGEMTFFRNDGTGFPVELTSVIYQTEKGEAFLNIIFRDITERKKAEEELVKSEEKFSKAFAASPEAITIASMEDGRYIDINEAAVKLTGFGRDEVIGHSSTELGVWLTPEDRQRYVETLARDGNLRNFETLYRMKNGEVHSFLVSSEIILLEGKLCSLNFLNDITERKLAEEALTETNHMLNTVFENSPIGIEIYDKDAYLLRSNKKIAEIFSNNPSEIYGKFNLKEDPNYQLPEIWERLERGEKVQLEIDYDFAHVTYETTGKGHRHHFILTTPIPDSASKKIGYFMQIIDITERKLAEEALRKTEERYHQIDEASKDMIYSYDLQGRFTHANSSLCKLLGLRADQIIGKTHTELGFPQAQCDEWDRLHKQVYENNASITAETMSPIQGEMRYFEVVLNPLHDENGNIIGIGGTTRDINERKLAEEKIKEQLDELNRWYEITLGREDRILELKKEVNQLLIETGKSPRYLSTAGDIQLEGGTSLNADKKE